MGDIGTPEFWMRATMFMVVFILSLTVHEYAHARVAFLLGDDTASRMGRLTLNPLSHIDFIGTIIMPLIGAISGIPVIGWAKPVPVTPLNVTRNVSMRTGHALIAAAGPMSNFILAFLCTFLIWLLFDTGWIPSFPGNVPVLILLLSLVHANIALGVFNLLPIPPLDGSRLLPQSFDPIMETVQRYSFMIFILFILFGSHYLIIPINFIKNILGTIFGINVSNITELIQTLA